MSGINQVTIVGRLGQDPEVRQTANQQAVATLSVATSEKWTDKEGKTQEKTEWHRCVAWGKTAELCGKYLKKGSLAGFTGKLQTRSWDDKDGVKKYTTEVIVQNVQFLGSKDDGQGTSPRPADNANAGPSGYTPPASFSDAGLDDIPF